MRKRLRTSAVLYFRRWSRRGYAAFASLGRQVKICRLRANVCAGEERKAGLETKRPVETALCPGPSGLFDETPPDEWWREPLTSIALTAAAVSRPEKQYDGTIRPMNTACCKPVIATDGSNGLVPFFK